MATKPSKNIQTGADRLVALVSEKKKIELADAAKQLGVGRSVVQEWAELLEQEGVLKIQYSLSKIWLIEHDITAEDVVTNAKEMLSARDAFARKIDVAITSLQSETASFEDVRKKFIEIQSHIKTEMEAVKKDLAELEQFDTLKKSLGKDVESQTQSFQKTIQEYTALLRASESSYQKFSAEITAEKKSLEEERQMLAALTVARRELDAKLADAERKISQSESRIKTLASAADTALANLNRAKSRNVDAVLAPLLKKSSELTASANDLLARINQKTSSVASHEETSRKVHDSFKGFFIKNVNAEKLITEIENDKNMLLKEMSALKERVETFTLLTTAKTIKEQAKDIEKSIAALESKRSTLRAKIEHLIELIKK